VSFDPANLLMTIATNNLNFYGTYQLEFSGSLNPYLLNYTSFDLVILPYPNSSPPRL
jgi:hypothetical protein